MLSHLVIGGHVERSIKLFGGQKRCCDGQWSLTGRYFKRYIFLHIYIFIYIYIYTLYIYKHYIYSIYTYIHTILQKDTPKKAHETHRKTPTLNCKFYQSQDAVFLKSHIWMDTVHLLKSITYSQNTLPWEYLTLNFDIYKIL